MTNADKIRAMTDEELAELIGDNIYCAECPRFTGKACGNTPKECHEVWLVWLRQEAVE